MEPPNCGCRDFQDRLRTVWNSSADNHSPTPSQALFGDRAGLHVVPQWHAPTEASLPCTYLPRQQLTTHGQTVFPNPAADNRFQPPMFINSPFYTFMVPQTWFADTCRRFPLSPDFLLLQGISLPNPIRAEERQDPVLFYAELLRIFCNCLI